MSPAGAVGMAMPKVDDLAPRLEEMVGRLAAPTIAAVREPLSLLLADLATAGLSPVGARLTLAELFRLLVIRAELGDLADQPAFTGQVVVITGPPRTGSTFLHDLFAVDRRNQHLTLAKALSPTATEEAAAAYASQYLALADRLSPALRQRHPMSPEGPDECITALQPTFMSEKFSVAYDLPRYGGWLDANPLHDTYRWYSRYLGSLYGSSGCLVLKAPAHLARLDAVRTAFPAAKFIVLSRPFDAVIDSFVELVAAARAVYAASVDPVAIRREWTPRLATAIESVPLWAAQDNDRVQHVGFERLVTEPTVVMGDLYAWLGWAPPSVEATWSTSAADLTTYHRRPTSVGEPVL